MKKILFLVAGFIVVLSIGFIVFNGNTTDTSTPTPTTSPSPTPSNNTSIDCTPEQRGVQACISIYQPVCAKINVQCITSPCPPVYETLSNSCEACKNSLVESYTEGKCTNE